MLPATVEQLSRQAEIQHSRTDPRGGSFDPDGFDDPPEAVEAGVLVASGSGAAVLVGEIEVGGPVVVQADEGAEGEVAHADDDGDRARDVGHLVRAAGVKTIHNFGNSRLYVNPREPTPLISGLLLHNYNYRTSAGFPSPVPPENGLNPVPFGSEPKHRGVCPEETGM
jgi:hypothetical protein